MREIPAILGLKDYDYLLRRPGRKIGAEKKRKGNLFYFSAPIFLPGVVSQAASPAQTENCWRNPEKSCKSCLFL